MKKLLAMALAFAMSVSLVACGGGNNDTTSSESAGSSSSGGEAVEESSLKVAMVFPGLITDEAFNQYTYEGLKRAESELGIKIAYQEEVDQDEQLEVIRQFAQAGYDIIIGQGGQFGEALSTVAKEFPDQQFVFSVATDTYDLDNMTAATVDYGHAGYLGGIMAASASKTGKVAMVTGEWYDPHRQMEAGFYMGAEEVNPDIEYTAVTTGDWADVTKAREASLSLIAQGYDVLFFCLDAAYAGVIAAAQDSKDVMVVSAVVDAVSEAPDVTVGSVVYNWEELGYEEAAGMLDGGKAYVLGMAENGITPVTNPDLLSADGQSAVDKAIEALTAGQITIKVNN